MYTLVVQFVIYIVGLFLYLKILNLKIVDIGVVRIIAGVVISGVLTYYVYAK